MSYNASMVGRTLSRRRFAAAGLAVAIVGVFGPADAADAAKLPKPTAIVVSSVTVNTISLKVGGSTVKNYDVFAGAVRLATALPSSSTVPLTVSYLQPDTSYSIQVRENTLGQVSALSNPIVVRTLVAAPVAAPSNLRLVTAVPGSITVAWDDSPTPDVFYDVFLNGTLVTGTTGTSVTIVGKYGYPNIIPGTEPKPGRNVVGVRATGLANGTFVGISATIEIIVNVPSS